MNQEGGIEGREERDGEGEGEMRRRGGGRGREGRERSSFVFWNVGGLGRQEEEFWDYTRKWDYIGMSETWVEEKGWNKIKGKLPNSHRWFCSFARRNKKRSRASGGMIIGIRERWCKEKEIKVWDGEQGVMVTRIRVEEKDTDLLIISIYNKDDWKAMEKKIKGVVEEYKEGRIIIGGDFNARIGSEEGNDIEGWETRRQSKDKKINERGRSFIRLVGEIGGYIMNGGSSEDKLGEFTYVGERGCSVIDYIIVNERCYNEIISFRVEERIDSDHMPLKLELTNTGRGAEEEKDREEKKEEEEKQEMKIIWKKQLGYIKRKRERIMASRRGET